MNKSLSKKLTEIDREQEDRFNSYALKYIELVCAEEPPTKEQLVELDDEVNKLEALRRKKDMVFQVANSIASS